MISLHYILVDRCRKRIKNSNIPPSMIKMILTIFFLTPRLTSTNSLIPIVSLLQVIQARRGSLFSVIKYHLRSGIFLNGMQMTQGATRLTMASKPTVIWTNFHKEVLIHHTFINIKFLTGQGGSQDEGGRRRRPHPRTHVGAGRGGGVCHWVPQPGIHGPARVQISAMLRLKVMRSPVN